MRSLLILGLFLLHIQAFALPDLSECGVYHINGQIECVGNSCVFVLYPESVSEKRVPLDLPKEDIGYYALQKTAYFSGKVKVIKKETDLSYFSTKRLLKRSLPDYSKSAFNLVKTQSCD